MQVIININFKTREDISDIFSIGKAGEIGFGVSAIEDEYLPNGFTKLKGHEDRESDNYGNVVDCNGSQMVFIRKFYFKWTKRNKCKISNIPKDGYVLHRAFINDGKELRGIFVDKFECGNDSGIFSSKSGLEPCSTYSGNNPISKLINTPNDNLGGLYKAVKTRGDSFNLTTAFTYNALSMLMFANNKNKLEQMTYHNNQKCGVVWIDKSRYELGSGFIKLNNENSIFKVLKQSVDINNIMNDTDAYNSKFYDDIDLSGVVDKDSGWVYTDDKVKTFSMKNITKTCLGIPKSKALSQSPNDTYAKAGIYRYLRNEMACVVGGDWGYSSYAGAFAMGLYDSRTDSYYSVGGRASFVVPM